MRGRAGRSLAAVVVRVPVRSSGGSQGGCGDTGPVTAAAAEASA